jgi:hypothetical protein
MLFQLEDIQRAAKLIPFARFWKHVDETLQAFDETGRPIGSMEIRTKRVVYLDWNGGNYKVVEVRPGLYREDRRRTGRRGRAWAIDRQGNIHAMHPRKRGFTRCRRPSAGMTKTWDGTLVLDCDACRELFARDREGHSDP